MIIASELKVGDLVAIGNIFTPSKYAGKVIKITPKYFHVQVEFAIPKEYKFDNQTLVCKENHFYQMELQ